MKPGFRRSIGWLAAEILVVIVGILLAISIDSWMTGFGERRAERELLRSLSGEFAANDSLLTSQFGSYERRRLAAETLLDLGPQAISLEADSLNTLWRWVLWRTSSGRLSPGDESCF